MSRGIPSDRHVYGAVFTSVSPYSDSTELCRFGSTGSLTVVENRTSECHDSSCNCRGSCRCQCGRDWRRRLFASAEFSCNHAHSLITLLLAPLSDGLQTTDSEMARIPQMQRTSLLQLIRILFLLFLHSSLSHTLGASDLPSPPVSSWSVSEVVSFLSTLHLPDDHSPALLREQIDGVALLELTSEEWRDELGVTKLGQRKKLEKAVRELREREGLQPLQPVGATAAATEAVPPPKTAQVEAKSPLPPPAAATPPPPTKKQSIPAPPAQPPAAQRPAPPSPPSSRRKSSSALSLSSAQSLLRLSSVPLPPVPVAHRTTRQDEVRITELIRHAVAAHQRAEYAQARAHYEKVITLNPRHPRALHMLALLQMQEHPRPDGSPTPEAFQAALKLFRESLALAMEADTLTNLGNLYYSLGKPGQERAVTMWWLALEMQPLTGGPPLRVRFAEVLYDLALQMHSAGKVDTCREYLEYVVVLASETAYMHYPPEYTPRMSEDMNRKYFDEKGRFRPSPPSQEGNTSSDEGRLASHQSSSPIEMLHLNAEIAHGLRVVLADAWLHLGLIAEADQARPLALAYYQRTLAVKADWTDTQRPVDLRISTILSEARDHVARFEAHFGSSTAAARENVYSSPEYRRAWERVMRGQVMGAIEAGGEEMEEYKREIEIRSSSSSSSSSSTRTPKLYPGVKRTRKLIESLHKSCRTSSAFELARMIDDDEVFQSPRYAHLFQSPDEITRARATFSSRLDALLVDPAMENRWSTGSGMEWCRARFYQAYHGLPNTEIARKMSRVYERAFPGLRHTAAHLREDPTNGLGERIRQGGAEGKDAPKESGGLSSILASLTGSSSSRGRIRIGFISAFLNHHPVGRTLRGYIEHLPRDRFEVYVYFITLQGGDFTSGDTVYNSISTLATKFTTLPPENWSHARRVITEDRLDVLVYPDIGMEPTTYFLAFSRLAPIQAMTFGHPDTSGIGGTMDYFLSHADMEVEDEGKAQELYTERLVRLPGIGYWYRAELPPSSSSSSSSSSSVGKDIGREYFGIADEDLERAGVRFEQLVEGDQQSDAGRSATPSPNITSSPSSKYTLYLVTKSVQFFSPDFQQALASILHRHPRSFLVLLMDTGRHTKGFDTGNACVEEIYDGIESRLKNLQQKGRKPSKEEVEWTRRAREQRHPSDTPGSPPWENDVLSSLLSSTSLPSSRPGVSGRIRFVDRGDHPYFMHLVRVADVLLQPMPLDGTTTTLEAITLGTPTVIHRSQTIGGRMAWAIYRKMGFTETCAATMEEYVDIAVRLGTDPAFAQRVRDRLSLASSQSGRGQVFEDPQAIEAYAEWIEQATSKVVADVQATIEKDEL
jgi:hypothetical protein